MDEGYRYAAYVMHQAGRHEDAIALLRTGVHLARGRAGVTGMLAGACAKQAKAAFREGRVLAGLRWGIEAWRARPSLPLELLRARGSGARRTGDAGSGS
jgi:hypothetical protein